MYSSVQKTGILFLYIYYIYSLINSALLSHCKPFWMYCIDYCHAGSESDTDAGVSQTKKTFINRLEKYRNAQLKPAGNEQINRTET